MVPLKYWPSAAKQLMVRSIRDPKTDDVIVVDDGKVKVLSQQDFEKEKTKADSLAATP